MSRWFRNGESTQHVPVGDRAFQYGDGLFETVAIRDAKPRLWDYHLDRLQAGCERLRIDSPAPGKLRRWLDRAIHISSPRAREATVKIVLSAGLSTRGYGRSMPTEPAVYIGVFAAQAVAAEHYRDGVEALMCETRLAAGSTTAGLKTLNRLEQVLARSETMERGAFEGLTRDAEGRVICGTMSNVFTITDNSIATPSLHRCGVEGVMRRHIITALAQRDRSIDVRDIGESDFLRADEVFLCNSQFGIIPVRQCGERTWSDHAETRLVMSVMAEAGIRECAR